MANVSVLLSDLKTGRSSSTVQVRLLRFLAAMNVCQGGKLMGVDMLLHDSQATMMPATVNVNRLATHMPNLKSNLIGEITVVMSTVTDPSQDKNCVMATIKMDNDMYVTMSLFDSQAVKIHNQQETMRGNPRVVVATSVNPKMVGGRLFLNATSGTHIYFHKETTAGESFFYIYRAEMSVADETGEALFVCFDGVLTKLHNTRALYNLNK
ncbi:hypothetical protein HID58_043926 [Brassica napus]|uniref:Uncharacterized protein n=1 Tax=Brassica napus TaxID=3708 RepID=A0ABQ8BI43_BRANA|nr:hypothetical protein HID58_043926 [Brassica napus]